ncbi:hypothetical protein JZ751_009311 [Albula glossodonta]|uniref:Uncharacterized protein n=1 Tax=Albula glossodonta TaxID=121402 RepID=A0A8T2N0P5_9TELE|nr:hypothetical protein JZ751_009311 [Albula glossodonta]
MEGLQEVLNCPSAALTGHSPQTEQEAADSGVWSWIIRRSVSELILFSPAGQSTFTFHLWGYSCNAFWNASCVLVAARHASASTNLKDVLTDLIPKEQARIKNFKQQYGKTNIGQITVDMVSDPSERHRAPAVACRSTSSLELTLQH